MSLKYLPNFLIVGAPKSGTTSLYYYLKQHPKIFLSKIKEPFFLAFNSKNISTIKDKNRITPSMINDFESYQKLFQKAKQEQMIGEASTFYLYFYKQTIKNIYKYFSNPQNIKIIMLLRNPTERAFSHFMFNRRNLVEMLNFKEALQEEKYRIKNKEHFTYYYQDVGFYYEQVKAYLDNFKNVKIIIFDEFIKSIDKEIDDIFNFLSLSKINIKHKKIYNISGKPKSKTINFLTYGDYKIKRIIEKILPKSIRAELVRYVSKYNLKKIKIENTTKKYLQNIYKKDISKLEKLLNKDLSFWLK